MKMHDDRGAALIQVIIGFLALFAFSTFVMDYGVFWTSRRQAQNAADAAALSGAVALAYDDGTDSTGVVSQSAFAESQRNNVWGQPPSVVAATDIQTPATGYKCPDDGTSTCVRVDVYRTSARGNALPVFFGVVVGLSSQDVKASAVAKVSNANATNCLKPWAVIDKWQENWPAPGPWTTDSTFDKYDNKGNIDPSITNPDVYTPPTEDDPGTGFRPRNPDGSYTADYGLELTLKVGSQSDFSFASGWFSALALGNSRGGNDYETNIKTCVGVTYKIGDTLPVDTEPGEKVGPTKQGVATDADSLVQQDPGAHWDATMNGGHGGVAGSAFPISPRIVAIPLVNPDAMAAANQNGRTGVPIANILGFFVEGLGGTGNKGVIGRLMTIPGSLVTTAPGVGGESSFLKAITLIR